jgi:hypothetical protein
MTKKEKAIYNELKAEIDALIRQYTMLLETREIVLKEARELRRENVLLRAAQKLNGQCYFYSSGAILPFKWRG